MPDLPAIQQDILCPQCNYNLRGLRGDVVSCPECGLQCDVARIIANRWVGPWQLAPGYSLVVLPSMLFLFIGMPGLMLGVSNLMRRLPRTGEEWAVFLIIPLIMLLFWVLALIPLFKHFGFKHGLRIGLLGHLLLLAYVAAMVGTIGFTIAAGTEGNPGFIIYAGLFAALFYACRLIDRAIAESCIRLHLRFAARV